MWQLLMQLCAWLSRRVLLHVHVLPYLVLLFMANEMNE